ncbi:MAG: DUF423 domain-containing protein [Rhodospirillales bacterium]|nr:DUF423 domain-containing protein [Rhodospirillales bacterium]
MTAQAAEREPLCALAAIAAAAAVGLGAYGAHGLAVDDFLLDVWRTAVAFQMWHALGAFACVWLASRKSGRAASLARISGWLLIVGALSFSSSLYAFVLMGDVPVQGLAPAGGMIMMAGWSLLAVAAVRRS